MSATPITHLFLGYRRGLAHQRLGPPHAPGCGPRFGLDPEDLNDRHEMSFDTYEQGKLDLDTYLNQVVFYQERPFTREDFKAFMFAQSKPKVEMINLVSGLKWKHRLKTAAISNEGRELTIYRIKKFDLTALLIFSCRPVLSTSANPTWTYTAWPWTSPRRSRPGPSISTIGPCLWRSPKAWGSTAFITPTFEVTRSALKDLGLTVED